VYALIRYRRWCHCRSPTSHTPITWIPRCNETAIIDSKATFDSNVNTKFGNAPEHVEDLLGHVRHCRSFEDILLETPGASIKSYYVHSRRSNNESDLKEPVHLRNASRLTISPLSEPTTHRPCRTSHHRTGRKTVKSAA
jgi:hypothetical protein